MNHSFHGSRRSIIYPREIDPLRENRWLGFGKGLKKDLNGREGRRDRRSSHFGYEVPPRGRNDARDNLWPCSNRLEHRCQLVSRGWHTAHLSPSKSYRPCHTSFYAPREMNAVERRQIRDRNTSAGKLIGMMVRILYIF